MVVLGSDRKGTLEYFIGSHVSKEDFVQAAIRTSPAPDDI